MDTTIIIKKKKGHGDHGHHGGSWKVAYADFVTAMMAFFMVMWIIGLSDSQKHEVAAYFKDPFGYVKQASKSEKVFTLKGVPETKSGIVYEKPSSVKVDQKGLEEVEKQIQKQASSAPDLSVILKYVAMSITSDGLRIELCEGKGSVFFETGSAIIRPEAMKLIHRMAPIIGATKRKVVIEGHTDAQPYSGTSYTNLDLSCDRAKSLYHALLECGMDVNAFSNVRGLGSSQLKDPEHPLSFANRRVSILIPFKPLTPTSDGLPKDALNQEIQGAFHTDLDIAPIRPK